MSGIDLLRAALPEVGDLPRAAATLRPFVRRTVAEILARLRSRPSHATPMLAEEVRRRRLGSRDRPVVVDAICGIARHEAILRRAGAVGDEGLLEGWAALVGGERLCGLEASTPEADLATALSLPEEIARAWLQRLGPEEAAALAQALGGRAPLTIRVNRARIDREALVQILASEGVESHPTGFAPHGLHLPERVNLPQLGSYKSGLFEVQDESSQRLCAALEVAPGSTVMDLCAGAGGKSLALAASGATVWAWDPRADALRRLTARAARARVQISVGPPRAADLVLVDAPCSGSGRLRREPLLRWALEPWGRVEIQRQLLAQGAELVPPGGRLAYATCSMLPWEQEQQPEGPFTLEQEVVLWPHRDGCDGFSWRIWRRV